MTEGTAAQAVCPSPSGPLGVMKDTLNSGSVARENELVYL